jgi:hypothetical protein
MTYILQDNGSQCWYLESKLHRDRDLPAFISPEGLIQWYRYGKLHRENDQPASIWTGVRAEWFKNGLRHRDNDLPAVETHHNGHKEWWSNGNLHRYDGPAIQYSYAVNTCAYIWQGEWIDQNEHAKRVKAGHTLKRALLHDQPVWRWRLHRWVIRMVVLNRRLKVRDLCILVITYLTPQSSSSPWNTPHSQS